MTSQPEWSLPHSLPIAYVFVCINHRTRDKDKRHCKQTYKRSHPLRLIWFNTPRQCNHWHTLKGIENKHTTYQTNTKILDIHIKACTCTYTQNQHSNLGHIIHMKRWAENMHLCLQYMGSVKSIHEYHPFRRANIYVLGCSFVYISTADIWASPQPLPPPPQKSLITPLPHSSEHSNSNFDISWILRKCHSRSTLNLKRISPSALATVSALAKSGCLM